MASILEDLYQRGILTDVPRFVPGNVHYEVIMGSTAYGVSTDESDWDIYGFCTPPRDYVFPHLRGEIAEFSTPGPRFAQYQRHHVQDPQALAGRGREYDFAIYSIVKYFRLCMDNNPNIIDSLFVPRRCVLYASAVGEHVRENRHRFLHKGAWHKFKGYAYAQMNKMRTKQPEGKRKAMVEAHGYDVKFAYHIVRLLNEIEQILGEGDLDLERNREQLKAIRRGEWSVGQIEQYFEKKERELETRYTESRLPHRPNEADIRDLLLECLEQHYGSLDQCIGTQDEAVRALKDIDAILHRARKMLG